MNAEFMQDEGKVYEGEITGLFYHDEDAKGSRVERTSAASLDAEEVDCMIAQMVGEMEQVPPTYSAVKVTDVSSMAGGKKWNAGPTGNHLQFTRTSD